MRVAVVGFGVAGATVAALLARQGHDVTVYERARELGPVGAGLLLQPSGRLALERIGIFDEVRENAEPIGTLFARTHGGRTVMNLEYGRDGPAYGVHRRVLFDALRRAAESAGVHVELGREIRSHEELDADVVLACDGSTSAVRESAGLTRWRHDYAYGALWAIGGCAVRGRLHQVVRGTRDLLGLLPLGGGRCNFFWSQRIDEWPAVRERGFERWRARVLALAPEAAPIFEEVGSWDDVALTSYRHVVVHARHRGRLLLLGDAGHAMSPHLGQGVNLALLDALTCARLLERERDPQRAFARFERERRTQLRYYGAVTAALTPFFQSNGVVKGWGRDLALPLLTRVPPLRAHMVLTMSGMARGFVPRRIPIDA